MNSEIRSVVSTLVLTTAGTAAAVVCVYYGCKLGDKLITLSEGASDKVGKRFRDFFSKKAKTTESTQTQALTSPEQEAAPAAA